MGNETSQNTSYGDSIDNDIVIRSKKVSSEFPAREGQICCVSGTRVYAFGGVSQHGEELRESNDLTVFETEKQEWTKLVVKGCPPPPRTAAAIAAVGHKLYLFGGLSHAFGWFDDLYCFDVATNTWSVVSADGPKPLPRDKLQCVALGKKIYYFGGFGPKSADADQLESEDDESEDELPDGGAEFGWFNDLYVLDTEKNQWSQPMQMNLALPTPRAAHAMCVVDRDLIIFGGRDMDARQNDLHVFNVDTRKWATDLQVKGRQPEPRSFHTAFSVGKRAVIMGGRGTGNQHFADIHIFDTETREWLQPTCEGELPEARGQHSVAVAGDKLIVFGGSGKYSDETMQCQSHFTDTFIMDAADFTKGGAKTKQNGSAAANGASS
ncbi:rab9 effector protein with kelch motifs-like [Haliotis rufescens]|uniref:rab9 effector protein with kelch motifs-like n=1 Tax=Haliotis rufescens TaxID=6454 RepID=UPI00201E94BC|nr:rab9 effector protein with kelch motifs-like [Haliotis rufescens]